jgi:phosphohistidine swiveling domain-containing protein
MIIPEPIFSKDAAKISWTKIYEREYGVQYSEAAVAVMAFCPYHFPTLSFFQIVIPGTGQNTAFYIDCVSWKRLVEGLNNKYIEDVKGLKKYEKQFLLDGNNYLSLAKKIQKTDLGKLSNLELLSVYIDHQDKKMRYSNFAWSAFILNNYVAERATEILDIYIKRHGKEELKQDIYDSLLTPHKKAAVLELQHEVEKKKGKLTPKELNKLYNRFKWLSCLDIQNSPWTKKEFENHIESFMHSSGKKISPFKKYLDELKINKKDLEYLLMAKRFVYIKDARDDFRRESVYYANHLFKEIGRRMDLAVADTSYLQEKEIISFLRSGKKVNSKVIVQRKKSFVIYLDSKKRLICVEGNKVSEFLKTFGFLQKAEQSIEVTGVVASRGKAKGPVVIVKGIKDLRKVSAGHVLVTVTTHPDFVPAMRKVVAIITDEGGITSHAAIVSREFGIPCIVGCRNATKLLKDGDVVEVDAINGRIFRLA